MHADEFSSLSYNDQLRLINHSGKLRESRIIDEYQVTVYKVKDFYVELRRCIHELTFETITTIHYRDLPDQYR